MYMRKAFQDPPPSIPPKVKFHYYIIMMCCRVCQLVTAADLSIGQSTSSLEHGLVIRCNTVHDRIYEKVPFTHILHFNEQNVITVDSSH